MRRRIVFFGFLAMLQALSFSALAVVDSVVKEDVLSCTGHELNPTSGINENSKISVYIYRYIYSDLRTSIANDSIMWAEVTKTIAGEKEKWRFPVVRVPGFEVMNAYDIYIIGRPPAEGDFSLTAATRMRGSRSLIDTHLEIDPSYNRPRMQAMVDCEKLEQELL